MINAIALAEVRTARGLSQRKLATSAGLNYQVIRRLEAGGDDGRLTLREFERICCALDIAPAKLLGSDSPTPQAVNTPGGRDELDVGQAKLLRRIQTARDVSRTMTRVERQAVLPTLLKAGLVRTNTGSRYRLSRTTAQDIAHIDDLVG